MIENNNPYYNYAWKHLESERFATQLMMMGATVEHLEVLSEITDKVIEWSGKSPYTVGTLFALMELIGKEIVRENISKKEKYDYRVFIPKVTRR